MGNRRWSCTAWAVSFLSFSAGPPQYSSGGWGGTPKPHFDGKTGFVAAAGGGLASCWIASLTYESCCFPLPRGEARCWDSHFTYDLCCTSVDGSHATPPVASPEPEAVELIPEPEVQYIGIEDMIEFGGCELDFFQRFKTRAAAWYISQKPQLSLFHELAFIIGKFDKMLKSCVPAVLTAMLLKLETLYFEEEKKWGDTLQLYIETQHRAVADGTVTQEHHKNGWPLLTGLNHVMALRALGRRTKPAQGMTSMPGHGAANPLASGTTVGRATPPVVDLVVCYCGKDERIDWLALFHKMPWRDEDRSHSTRALVALRFYHKCGGLSQEAQRTESKRLVDEWGSFFHTVEVRFVDDVVRADDCSAYLQYAVDRYYDLPPYTVFLHADAPEHIPSIELLLDTVFAASRGYIPPDVGFLHLAHNYVQHDHGCAGHKDPAARKGAPKCGRTRDADEFETMWKNVFDSSFSPSMSDGDLNAYCCVQFLVQRDRILLRDRAFYERALHYFGGSAESYFALFPAGRFVWYRDTLGRTPCQLAMYIWHAMFGEQLRLPRRHLDPRLPLFMKMSNIEVEAIGEFGDDDEDIAYAMQNQDTDYYHNRFKSFFGGDK